MAKDLLVASCYGWLLATIDSPADKLCSAHLALMLKTFEGTHNNTYIDKSIFN